MYVCMLYVCMRYTLACLLMHYVKWGTTTLQSLFSLFISIYTTQIHVGLSSFLSFSQQVVDLKITIYFTEKAEAQICLKTSLHISSSRHNNNTAVYVSEDFLPTYTHNSRMGITWYIVYSEYNGSLSSSPEDLCSCLPQLCSTQTISVQHYMYLWI